ncbi:MAG: tRNA (adenosine(37)-N6)-threonylcarbamoyltransferase complex ATPase subunit type 1 TsaE [Rickettsiales bacterium]
MKEIRTQTLEETVQLGRTLAASFSQGNCILLKGEVGMGKTELARAIIRALCRDADLEVTSPTFTLAQDYSGFDAAGKPVSIWHYDLYRVEHREELMELALDEAFAHSIVLVEWPENAPTHFWPEDAMIINITAGKNEFERIFAISENEKQDYAPSSL